MKTKIFLVAAALMAAMSMSAQNESKHEVGAFYGIESASNIFSIYTSIFSAAAGDQSSWWGPVGAEYYYHLSPGVSLGGVLVYAGCKAKDEKTNENDLTETFITVMPSVKFNWLRKKYFGMYSALSAGIMFASVKCGDSLKNADPDAKDETLTTFMFQATALGLEVGGALRGFAELGLGEKGTFCAGLRYRF